MLVTGSTGFVGSHFLSNYKNDYEILTVDLRSTPPDQINLIDVDCILHLAACVHHMHVIPDENYFTINTKLTENLAKHAKKNNVKHFIFMSTAHVYGDVGSFNHTLSYNELTPCNPLHAYAQSKYQAEQILQKLADINFQVSILRPPMIYGHNAKGNLISLARLVSRFSILPFGFSENKRSIVYVENLAYFIHLVAQKHKAGIFLPQDQKPLSILEIVQNLATVQNKKVYLFRLPQFIFSLLFFIKPQIMTRLFGTLELNSSSSDNSLGYQALYSSQEGFRRMLSHKK